MFASWVSGREIAHTWQPSNQIGSNCGVQISSQISEVDFGDCAVPAEE